jgi:hypothetical protein
MLAVSYRFGKVIPGEALNGEYCLDSNVAATILAIVVNLITSGGARWPWAILILLMATTIVVEAHRDRRVRPPVDPNSAEGISGSNNTNDIVVAEAGAKADQLLAEARAEADAHARTAQRRVDDMTRQYETVQAHLAEISQLLGQPSTGVIAAQPEAVLAAPTLPDPVSPGTHGRTTISSSRPAIDRATHATRDQFGYESSEHDQDWWTK